MSYYERLVFMIDILKAIGALNASTALIMHSLLKETKKELLPQEES